MPEPTTLSKTSPVTIGMAIMLASAFGWLSYRMGGIEEKVGHRKVVIPGFVAVLSAGVEDESGWSVQIGPKEASGLPAYLKNQWKA